MKEYHSSTDAYDAGFEVEQLGATDEYKVYESYNLTQRLVARIFIDPGAAESPGRVVRGLHVREELKNAKGVIEGQLPKRPGDEYAVADLALVWLLLGDAGWERVVRQLLDMNPQVYAIQVTAELLKQLHGEVGGSAETLPALTTRLVWAREEFRQALVTQGVRVGSEW